ncbi:MAG: branched-chain amino acid ABC transporter permease [Treponema sp.]|nr:branched-chain amino acid ABC transporter permease [Treponema sp.]
MQNKVLRNMLIPGVVALLCVLLPFILIECKVIKPYVAQILTLGAVNAIMAISVNVVCGVTGQLSLGQAGFQALGAYSVVLLTSSCHVPLPVSIVLAGCIAALFGFLIGFPTLKLEGDYLAIVTLAFGEIIRVILVNLKSVTGGPNGMRFITFKNSVPAGHGTAVAYLTIVGTLVIIIVLFQNFLRSTYGRAILAVREDPVAANSNGIFVFRNKMVGFVIASFIAGIGGALYAPLIGFIQPKIFDFNASINDLIYVVLGGMGSMTGSVLAAFVLTGLQEGLRFLKDYRLLIYPVILIVMMLFRPQGLLGTREISFVKIWDSIPVVWKKLFAKKTQEVQ